ncbi:hypothetical protein B0H10DRAFT_1989889 [Mycena sp. CBHHK59/15]|nr:hypothetical protein B0H10DRAFT_1989889 [Mycena sp. CBHHK59/15]
MAFRNRDPSTTSLLRGGRDSTLEPSSPASASMTRHTLSEKFSFSPDPQLLWGSVLSSNDAELDDALHNPDVQNGKIVDRPFLQEV